MARLILGLLVVLLVAVLPVSAQESTVEGEPVVHVVQYGDTLYRIALRYGVTVDEIAAANDLANTWRIIIGQKLVIPGLTVPDDSDVVANPLIAGTPITYTVQPGDTLRSIADRYNLTVDQLMQANSIANPNIIYRGQELKVWTTESVSAPAEAVVEEEIAVESEPAAQTTHVVQSGETLGRIGIRYGVDWRDIVSYNSISDINTIYTGQVLYIPGVSSSVSSNTPVVRDPNITTQLSVVPTPAHPTDRHVIVDLSDARVYAYENGELVYSVLASTGLPATPTVQGDYKVYHRYDSQTMSGPGYYLPGVQWVQYFYQGYALHGAYWHNNWGNPMSHGCVNLPNDAAKWLYDFGYIGMLVRVQA